MTMENKKNVPDIRFKGFTAEWSEQTLGDCADIIGGGTPSTSNKEYWDGNIDWYSPAEIGVKIFADGSQRKITQLGLKESSAKILPIGTVLFSSRAGIGATAILAKEGTTNQGFQSIVPHREQLDSYFIFSRTNELKKYGETNGAGSTFIEISGKQMANMPIHNPEYDEQKTIGNYFQNIDRLIVSSQAKLDKLKTIKKACLEKMFPRNGSNIPEIRFKGFAEEWSKDPIGNMGNPFNGLTGKTKEDFGHGRAKFITYMNVFSNPISNLTQTENVEIDNKQNSVIYGDILFTVSSETPEEVGMSSVWLSNEENVYLNSFCFGYRLYKPKYSYFMAYVLRSKYMRKKIAILAQGISRYNISKGKVMEIDLPFPKYDEQQAIGNYFRDIDKLITLTEQKIEKLKNIKKACLDKMFVNTEDRYDTI